MQTTARRLRRRLAFLVVGVAAFLAVAGSAMAAPSAPGDPSATPPGPTNVANATFTWTAATPSVPLDPLAPLNQISSYQGGFAPGPDTNFGAALSTNLALPGTDGTYTFRVRAFEQPVGSLPERLGSLARTARFRSQSIGPGPL